MKNSYSLGETINNLISLIYTKMFFKDARLIRRPVIVRGKKYMQYGKGFTIGYNCRFEMFSCGKKEEKKLIIGENCKVGDNVHIAASEKVIIGDNCLMASKIFISDTSHGEYSNVTINSTPDIPPGNRLLYVKPVIIGNNVWIGENACILLGVTIGNGCIIGANSVVNKDIPDYCIAVGSPVKIIKKYDFTIKKWLTV